MYLRAWLTAWLGLVTRDHLRPWVQPDMFMAGAGTRGGGWLFTISITCGALLLPCTWDLTESRAKHNNNMLDSPHPPPPPPTEHWNLLGKPRLWSVLSWRIIEIRLNAGEGGLPGVRGRVKTQCSKARPSLESNGIYQSLMRTSQEYNCCVCNSSCVPKALVIPM